MQNRSSLRTLRIGAQAVATIALAVPFTTAPSLAQIIYYKPQPPTPRTVTVPLTPGRGLPNLVPFTELPVPMMAKRLSLTPTQANQLAQIQQAFKESNAAAWKEWEVAMRTAGSEGHTRLHDATKAVRETSTKADNDFRSTLTPAQAAKLAPLLYEASLFRGAYLPLECLADIETTDTEREELVMVWNEARWRDPVRLMRANRGSAEDRQAIKQENRERPGETYRKAVAVLSPERRKLVQAFVKTHPIPNREW